MFTTHVRVGKLTAWCLAGVGWLLFVAAPLVAQSVGGTVRGRVQDASGGVIHGAEVVARDAAKGISYQTRSDSLGLYQLELPVGVYQVQAAAERFSPVSETDLTLSLGQTLVLNFSLPVAGVQERIEVRAEAPLVDTSSGTVSGLVDRERLQALPLNGRDFGQLALLEPGVLPNLNGANAPFGGKWAAFVINGQIDQATLFLMDGSEINDIASGRNPAGSSGNLLGLDSVQEFRVLLQNFKAEFGRNSGGVIHVATRSGTNQWRGSAFEFLRNSALDAKNYFDLPQRPIPSFRRNQFGATLGGPLRKDHTFVFLNYEGLRERKSITSVATVPTAAARAAAVEAVRPFLDLYPLPNGPVNPDGRTASFTSSIVQPTREDYGLGRVDHRLPRELLFYGRLSLQDSLVEPPFPTTPVPGFPQSLPHRNTYTLAKLSAPLSPNALNEFHFAFNRTYGAIEQAPAPGGLSLTPVPGRNFGLLIVNGLSNLGAQTFVPRSVTNLFEIVENVSYRRGRHAQRYGVSLQRYQTNELRGTFFNGQYTFVNLTNFLAGTPASWIGVLGGTSADGPASPAGWRWLSYSAFAQDDFQLRPSLTLNFGIRYEFSTSPAEVNGQLANLRSPLDPQITYGPLFNPIRNSWAPRFGFAWSPLASGRAALRGGFGIFYNPLVVNMYGNSRLVPPFVNTVLIAGGPPFPNPLATGRTPVLSTTGQSIDYRLSQPYTEQWNLQWEQQLGGEWIVKAGYGGHLGLHIIRSLESNPAIPTILSDGRKCYNLPAASGGPNPLCPGGATTRRNSRFGSIRGRSSDGMSWYHSLQLSAERRFRQGWTFGGAYTWSKALSTNNSSFTTLPSQPSNTQDPEDIFLDKGRSAFDARHRLVLHMIYQIPGAPGASRVSWLLEGWSLSGIASVSSGLPFSVIDGINRSGNLQSDAAVIADRPDWNPDFSGKVILGDPARWFDPAAFRLQPAGFYGNVARNALNGPGFANVDASLSKTFVLREPHQLEFRADLFNLFNHPNFATPRSPTGAQTSGGVIVFPDASGVPSGSAGQIFSTVSDSRQIQFSLRYQF
ncbi:MAG TPA: carboxypeptidase regulatory-like domain-containing protein [Terriglobia bacterium]|nr:carboxypeptidase regulatory-like domain-containing protein [Terriglobia bacterium]